MLLTREEVKRRMFDLSSKFNTFYKECVVLPKDKYDELYKKKDLNLQRLKDGLIEYNVEKGTEYRIVETNVQGSVAMSTVVQNEENDYDIDVAVVFEKEELGDMGPLSARNIVADAFKRKTKQFNTQPEVKTSCVRVKYEEGYHLDFAVFRRSLNEKGDYLYEHAGSEWSKRELKALTDWFKIRNDKTDYKLRKVVRLSKMFCKSRDVWNNMPSGLLQTVLCDEKLMFAYERTDELFYYSMKAIVNRLESSKMVIAPVDNGRNLTARKSDIKKMSNWHKRLKSKLEDLDVLFDDDCTEADAIKAWCGFFRHSYWENILLENRGPVYLSSYNQYESNSSVTNYNETEEFIEDLFPVQIQNKLTLSCDIYKDGFRTHSINEFSKKYRRFIPHDFTVKCEVKFTDALGPYDVYWKVKNNGPIAEARNQVRGQIIKRGNTITEPTNFYGNHYIECYIVKNGICIARKKIDIPIGRK